MKKILLYSTLFISTLIIFSRIARAQTGINYTAPQIRLPLTQTAPTIDGVINDDEWKGADRMERFGRPAPLSPQLASFWVGGDAQNLYIAVRSQTPPDGKLLARVNQLPGDADARTYYDDSIELVIDPQHSSQSAHNLYHAIFNAKGAIYDMAIPTGGGAQPWRGKWQIGSKVTGDTWNFEVAIPWSDVGASAEDLQSGIGLRIGRNWKQTTTAAQTEWSPLGGPYLTPGTLPVVTFDADAPVVQVLQLQDANDQHLHIKMAVRNPHPTPITVKTTISTTPQNSLNKTEQKTLTIAPGATEIVEQDIALGQIDLSEALSSDIQVTSADGKSTFYMRNFAWQLRRPTSLWTLDQSAAKQAATVFAYYPSYHVIKLKTDLSALENPAQVKGVHVTLRDKATQTIIAQTDLPPLQNGKAEMEWTIPELNEGSYQLLVTYDGLNATPQTMEFVRHKFPWEGNSLGESDILVPPFTAIKVQGNTVSTILRDHTMNGLGLWDQVTALGKPLLTKPMRIEVQSGGKTYKAQGNLKFTEEKPTHVIAQANWSAGPLQGSTQSDWDFDGMMKSTFTLQPTDQTIDSATLIIPLDDKEMPLFHEVMTDGSLLNYAGKTPSGTGVVWDGSKAARVSIIGTYVPYIWLGGAKRGLSVFGDNDKGWVSDYKKPLQEIVRLADGTLELRLHLISIPTQITKARNIVIGFEATPIKPIVDDWRMRVMTSKGDIIKDFPRVKKMAFLGSNWQWGALTPSTDVYPRNEDFSIYDEFAREKQSGKMDDAFIEKWLGGYGKVLSKSQIANVQYGFRAMAGQPDNVVVYTDTRGARYDTPEGQTFYDEWNTEAYGSRAAKVGGGSSYDNDPVPSLRDYKIWYYKKMLDTFASDIYHDCVFLKSDFDTVSSAAYQLPDGRIQPSSGIFDMRALIRRNAILKQEMGRPNNTMVHMSGTALAPIMAFAGTHLTWEDHAGLAPFQERFRQDYVMTESIGQQFGTVPFALGLIKGDDKTKIAWAQRTGSGVLLTHEMKPLAYWDDYWNNYQRLLEFGYGTPQVKVFDYWDEDYPAQISGDQTSSLLLSKAGQALLIVCDYGEGGDIKINLNRDILGLKNSVIATDMETNQPLQITADGAITFTLKKDDFKVIHIGNP